jgi:hypothetical protein
MGMSLQLENASNIIQHVFFFFFGEVFVLQWLLSVYVCIMVFFMIMIFWL